MPEAGLEILAGMATPAVLLLANAMLILSTIQRLAVILDRVRETELSIAGEGPIRETDDLELLNDMLLAHASRARAAHRALLCFYSSAGSFVAVVVLLGLSGLGLMQALAVALGIALLGSVLLFTGALLLIWETLAGIRATDSRFEAVMSLCRQLARGRAER